MNSSESELSLAAFVVGIGVLVVVVSGVFA